MSGSISVCCPIVAVESDSTFSSRMKADHQKVKQSKCNLTALKIPRTTTASSNQIKTHKLDYSHLKTTSYIETSKQRHLPNLINRSKRKATMRNYLESLSVSNATSKSHTSSSDSLLSNGISSKRESFK